MGRKRAYARVVYKSKKGNYTLFWINEELWFLGTILPINALYYCTNFH